MQARFCVTCRLPRPISESVCQVCLQGTGGNNPVGIEDLPLCARLIAQNRWADAYACLEDLIVRNPEDGETCTVLAWIGYAVRDFRAVETWSHEAMRLSPQAAAPHVLMTLVFFHGSRWEEAYEESKAGLRCQLTSTAELTLLERLQSDARRRLPEHY